jgi:hypothetical protein
MVNPVYNRIFTLCRMTTWFVFLRMVWNVISSLPVKRGGSLSFLVGTISNVSVMEIGWTDVGSGNLTSGMARAHKTWHHLPLVVGFNAPPRKQHKQHSYQDNNELVILWAQLTKIYPPALSAAYRWTEEDPFHFWWFSLLPFQSYWTWYDGK